MNRRQFLQRFAAVPIAGALVEPIARTIFLPPRGGWPSHDDWVDYYGQPAQNFTNRVGSTVDLTQASLESLLEQIKKYQHPIVVRPKFIVSPEFAQDEEFRQHARFFGYRV